MALLERASSNTGQALVMSPSLLTKYLDAAKQVASHAVLLPDGIRFSTATTRRDWTEEIMADIRKFYQQFTEAGGAETVTQQGIPLDKNRGGGLPLAKYLTASLEVRDGKPAAAVAAERGLVVKYLELLVKHFTSNAPSPIWDTLRARWRAANPDQVPALVAEIEAWQKALWKFSSVGHIGKVDGPKAWMEPVTPLVARQDFKVKFAAPNAGEDLLVYLTATDAGDGSDGDFVVWNQPVIKMPGRPDLPLRDARNYVAQTMARREKFIASTVNALAAADAFLIKAQTLPELAKQHGIEEGVLQQWWRVLGLGAGGEIKLDHFINKVPKSGELDFVQGWRTDELPSVMANSSDQFVKIPGDLKAHGVVVHPTPTLAAAVGWQSPVDGKLRLEAMVLDAHLSCGNGATWALELRHGAMRKQLAVGLTDGGKASVIGPVENVSVEPGDLISLIIGPRDAEHTCDLTDLELKLATTEGEPKQWSLTQDVSGDILAGNPHADRLGNASVWHFYSESVSAATTDALIPAGSILARWQAASSAERPALAQALLDLLKAPKQSGDAPDAKLQQHLAALNNARFVPLPSDVSNSEISSNWGLDPAQFGQLSDGSSLDANSLGMKAPAVTEVRLPAELFIGAELWVSASLDELTGAEGSVQAQILTRRPELASSLQPSEAKLVGANGAWTNSNPSATFDAPIIVNEKAAARQRFATAFDEFREVFPAALCYTKIVPVDEVVTLTLFHREDNALQRLMLDEAQVAQLNHLWDELRFVSEDALTLVDVFEQLWQYSTQDGPNAPNGDKRLEPLGVTIKQHAAEFRERLIATEPAQLKAVLTFASQAYRRSLSDQEAHELRDLYQGLRRNEIAHDAAIRLTLARVLISSSFLYKSETPGPAKAAVALNDDQLASRLSYFLWSSQPDAELRKLASEGKLRDAAILTAQTERMMKDARVRRLAVEFGCSWLHVHGFDSLDEKSERHFPAFLSLREAMYEETIQFFTDLFQQQRPVLNVLDADYTFLNEPMAKHYGVPDVSGAQWRRVEGMKSRGRGGVLGQASTLAKQSGASRTSPILRGNWVSEVLLGDKLPRPPKGVPQLPEEETADALTVRQLTEKHSSDERCSHCHAKIDPFGFSLEGFDAIGRSRTEDLAHRPIDTKTRVQDGTEIQGLDGLRQYMLTTKREAFLRQFTRKLLGYALGRSVQFSDEPLLGEIRQQLESHDFSVATVIQMIVHSRQFQEIRGRETAFDNQ